MLKEIAQGMAFTLKQMFRKPLTLEWPDGRHAVRVVGPDVASGQAPQTVVEAGVWQSARPLRGYSLVGATVIVWLVNVALDEPA